MRLIVLEMRECRAASAVDRDTRAARASNPAGERRTRASAKFKNTRRCGRRISAETARVPRKSRKDGKRTPQQRAKRFRSFRKQRARRTARETRDTEERKSERETRRRAERCERTRRTVGSRRPTECLAREPKGRRQPASQPVAEEARRRWFATLRRMRPALTRDDSPLGRASFRRRRSQSDENNPRRTWRNYFG
jgi:hypothetical protein